MEAIRDLWENSPFSASQIALRFETTKSTIIGLAARGKWKSFNKSGGQACSATSLDSWDPSQPKTTSERLEALHREMDQLLGLDTSGHWSSSGRWVPGKRKEIEL